MPIRAKYFLLLGVTILAASSVSPGQKLEKDGLVLIGSVQSIKTIDKDDRRLYEVVVKIQFRNDSDTTLLMLSPQYMTRKIEFLFQSMGDESRPPDDKEKVVSTFSIQPKILESIDATDWDWFGWWIQKLDKPDPKDAGVLIFKPGVTAEYLDTINLSQKFRLEGTKDKKVKIWEGFSDFGGSKRGLPLSELPAFTIEYQVSVGNRYKNPEILRDLRDRWSKYGRLVIDSDGGFTLKSQRILNSDGK